MHLVTNDVISTVGGGVRIWWLGTGQPLTVKGYWFRPIVPRPIHVTLNEMTHDISKTRDVSGIFTLYALPSSFSTDVSIFEMNVFRNKTKQFTEAQLPASKIMYI